MWEEGPMRSRALLERLLQQAVDAGKLEIPNIARAATQFISLIKGDSMMRHMFGCVDCQQSYAREIEENARASVTMFLRAYSPSH
jgi:hypothetical protein